jgi:hypothetical protein
MILPKIDDSNFSEINSEKEEDNEPDVSIFLFRATIVNLSTHMKQINMSSNNLKFLIINTLSIPNRFLILS